MVESLGNTTYYHLDFIAVTRLGSKIFYYYSAATAGKECEINKVWCFSPQYEEILRDAERIVLRSQPRQQTGSKIACDWMQPWVLCGFLWDSRWGQSGFLVRLASAERDADACTNWPNCWDAQVLGVQHYLRPIHPQWAVEKSYRHPTKQHVIRIFRSTGSSF